MSLFMKINEERNNRHTKLFMYPVDHNRNATMDHMYWAEPGNTLKVKLFIMLKHVYLT